MTHTPRPSPHPTRLPLAAALLAAALGAGACGHHISQPPGEKIVIRTQPEDVVTELILAYKHRDDARYGRILADDYHFQGWVPAGSGDPPDILERRADLDCTDNLFSAPNVKGVRISLLFGDAVPDNTVGHEGWWRVRVTDTFLEVDEAPETVGEVLTYRVDGDMQDMWVRRGRSLADTLPDSDTAQQWFLVRWQDLGQLNAGGPPAHAALNAPAAAPTAVAPVNWTNLKVRCAVPTH